MAQAVAAVKAAGGTGEQPKKLLDQLGEADRRAEVARPTTLAHELEHAGASAEEHAKYFRDSIVPAMASLRETGDALELLVPHGEWPLPTYREMLFIK